MFKNHPKGLIVAFFTNMGERFGFYTMMAILVLFLQAKYGLSEEKAGDIYSWFYFGIYALALVGGLIADFTKNYKGVIFVGIIVMLLGYVVIATPGMSLTITVIGLFTIALGNGLFKGNLQALVGQLYDNEQYGKLRDSAFMLFYMGINIGAFFAPNAATAMRNWFLRTNGFQHDANLPALCHQFRDGALQNVAQFQTLANNASLTGPVTDLQKFATDYLDVFARGYNYAFGIAAVAMIISLISYVLFHKLLPNKRAIEKTKPASEKIQMSSSEEWQRVFALLLVFVVVIFFWMSFHQNGLTLTFFARDYTVKQVGPITNIYFDLKALLSVIAAIIGLVFLFNKKNKLNLRLIGGLMTLVGAVLAYWFYSSYQPLNDIQPETFQQFNPLFIVFLTPVFIAFFAMLNKRGKEPSTPKKIGIGMIIAAIGFLVILVGSIGLPSPASLKGTISPERASAYWLITNYLILTVAELFLSPMGLSFVSKVAPPRLQGLMQGGWLAATATGNKLLFVGSYFWSRLELWQLWAIFMICCLLSAAFIFSIMKWLEKATKS
ncbi:MAG: peptide MFS transporter [candidate division KSB1 bacterium]|nr:peptide MFS transporter [candidate division KSB1 bacterium]MDZ7318651.1 peptide MFS transporter [candidate division KSB1 bacterium]